MSKTYFLTCSPNFLELYSSQSQLMGNWLLKGNPLNQSCFSSFFCNISVPLGQHAGSHFAAAAAAKPLQSCPTLCNPIDGSPPGSPSPGFSTQEYWNGLPFPSPLHACMLSRFSHVCLCATPWTAVHQAPLYTELSRQEYQSGLPFSSP